VRLASSVPVAPRPSPGSGYQIQLGGKVQGRGSITGREGHDHTGYDFSKKTPTPRCGLGVPAVLCKAYRLGRLAVCSAESGCPLTRAAQGSRESKLLRQRTALHLGRVFSQHTSPSSSWRAESRAGLVALGSALPPRARCLRPVSVPVSLLMGLFAPRRLSLPSTPDGSLPPLSGC
jgi:hypothetical protein